MLISTVETRMALNGYEQLARLMAAGTEIKPKRMGLLVTNHDRQMVAEHILWMIGELRKQLNSTEHLDEKKQHKLLRWICWIQGALCFAKMMHIHQGRRDNYKILNDGKEPPEDG